MILLGILMTSCKPELDRTDLNSIKIFTKHYIETRDYESLLNLTNYKTLDTIEKLIFKSNSRDLKKCLFNTQNIKYLKTDIENNQVESLEDIYESRGVNYYFEGDGEIYQIKTFVNKVNGELFYKSIICNNLSFDCLISKNQRYVPTNVSLSQGYWLASKDKKSFIEFNLKGQNKSLYKIEEIEFKLRMESLTGDEFLSKTIKKKVIIMPGDTFDIKINELKNHFVGFILSKETFSFSTEILSISPKPTNESCQIIERFVID